MRFPTAAKTSSSFAAATLVRNLPSPKNAVNHTTMTRHADLIRLQITQPLIPPALLEVREPTASGIEQNDHQHPDQIHHRQVEAVVGRSEHGRLTRGGRNGDEPVGATKSKKRHCHCQPVSERQVQKVVEQWHAAEDERWSQDSGCAVFEP